MVHPVPTDGFLMVKVQNKSFVFLFCSLGENLLHFEKSLSVSLFLIIFSSLTGFPFWGHWDTFVLFAINYIKTKLSVEEYSLCQVPLWTKDGSNTTCNMKPRVVCISHGCQGYWHLWTLVSVRLGFWFTSCMWMVLTLYQHVSLGIWDWGNVGERQSSHFCGNLQNLTKQGRRLHTCWEQYLGKLKIWHIGVQS